MCYTAYEGKATPMDAVKLPIVFNSEGEPSKFLARLKRRASKCFRWTHRRSLEESMLLAYWLYVFGEDANALEVCQFLTQAQLTVERRHWPYIEGSLSLLSRLLRSQGQNDEAAECIEPIRTIINETFSPGVPEARLAGAFLRRDEGSLEGALTDATGMGRLMERSARESMLVELCTLIELGGSLTLPVSVLEEKFEENLCRLKELAASSK